MTRRLVLSYVLVTALILVLLEVPLAIFFQQRELDRLTVDAERDATVLATIYEDTLERGLTVDSTPADEYAVRTTVRVVVVDEAGFSIVDTGARVDRNFSTRPEIAEALTGNRSVGIRRSETLDTELLYIAVPVASGGTVHGALRLTVDTDEVTARIWKFWIGLMAIAAIILIVMAGVGWIIARSLTRPVRRLQLAADRFSHGDLNPTETDTRAPPELAALETALNEMARRLDGLIGRQRAFVADASHQLRTPLTALRLRLENLQSVAAEGTMHNQPNSAMNSTIDDELSSAIRETERLGSLVGALLQLATAEESADLAATDLSEIARDRVDIWTATADLSNVSLRLVGPSSAVVVMAVPGGLEQVLDNLLDNAIEAAPPDTSVTVSVRSDDSHGQISIADLGAGLGDDDKRRATDRFWRANDGKPGTGLGLSIAQSIVDACHGTLSLTDNTPNGLVARLVIPLAAVSV